MKGAKLLNSFKNMVTGSGTEKDQGSHNEYCASKSISDSDLSAMYADEWLVSNGIDIPIKDMLRPWRTFKDESLSKSFIEAEKKFKVKKSLMRVQTWAWVFGGAFIVPSYDNSVTKEDYKKPFDLSKMKASSLRGFRIFTQGQFTKSGTSKNTDIFDDRFGYPDLLEIKSDSSEKFIIHNSWLIPFKGVDIPPVKSSCKTGNDWAIGSSKISRVYDDIMRSIVGLQETSSMMLRSNIDVYKVKDLADQLAECEGDPSKMYSAISKRLSLVSLTTSNHQKMVVDADEEGIERTNLSPNGWDSVTFSFVKMVASGWNIPLTKYLGESASGFNASGDSEIRNYYDDLAGERDDELTPGLNQVDEIIAKDLGVDIPEWQWNSLWQMSEKEQSDVNKKNAETFQIYNNADMQFVDVAEFERLKKEGVYNFTDEQLSEVKETDELIEEPEE